MLSLSAAWLIANIRCLQWYRDVSMWRIDVQMVKMAHIITGPSLGKIKKSHHKIAWNNELA